ncbi:MAG: methyltransferase, partial [Roseiflexaceae bacterium]
FLADARSMPIDSDSIDFILTSPPYINVFNYHQNYRRSAEMLNWDLLHVAKSEIGSNRANRGNRFLTVIQYCLDMACVVKEMRRVCRDDAQVILVVGYESNVLGVPFYNADILEALACESGLFDVHLRQKREFKNKFGNIIREDLLHLKPSLGTSNSDRVSSVARAVANRALLKGIPTVAEKNKRFLKDAVEQVDNIESTPVFSNSIHNARILS